MYPHNQQGLTMLKLFLCSAFIAPCFIIPFTGTSAESYITKYETTSFEEAYIEPEFSQLENCKAAELDVFFHENYITSHSAEYIAEGIELSKDCGDAKYVITPIIPASSDDKAADIVDTQTKELSLILKAHGVNAKVARTDKQAEFNSLSANGRTATLKIVFNQSDTA